MKLIDRLVLKELLGPFIFGICAFTLLFFAGDYLQDLSSMVTNGLPLSIAFLLVCLYLPTVVFYTLPMATLLSVIFSIGRLSGESEMTAMFASGISYRRIMLPVCIFVVFASLLSYFLNDYVAPASFTKLRALEVEFVDKMPVQEKPMVFFDDSIQAVITIYGGINLAEGKAKDITVVQYKDGIADFIICAKEAVWQGLKDSEKKYDWIFFDGFSQKLGENFSAKIGFSKTETKSIEIKKDMDDIGLILKSEKKNALSNMSFFELKKLVEIYRKNPDSDKETLNLVTVMMWNRFSLPMSCIILGLIAAPLAIRSHRTSAGIGIGISLLVIFVYYIVWNYGSSLAHNGAVLPFIGSFGANILGLMVAFYFNRRVRM